MQKQHTLHKPAIWTNFVWHLTSHCLSSVSLNSQVKHCIGDLPCCCWAEETGLCPRCRGAGWMSAAWVKMCFCLLSLGGFHLAVNRAHSPGQGAPFLLPCVVEPSQMCLSVIHSRPTDARLRSLFCFTVCSVLKKSFCPSDSLTHTHKRTEKNENVSYLKKVSLTENCCFPSIFREDKSLKVLDTVGNASLMPV